MKRATPKNRNHKNSPERFARGSFIICFFNESGRAIPKAGGTARFAFLHGSIRYPAFSPMRRKKRRQAAFYRGGGSFPDGFGWATQAISLLNMMGKNEKPL
ncbi:MAG TPA: hypothetical protein PLU75_00010 [Oscillospiraceae bacterium]|nr:hypothetical protein [Oscillospiraceae bacterium]HRW56541.1 hypothetical protein [Oscillospiraceae bacterium]